MPRYLVQPAAIDHRYRGLRRHLSQASHRPGDILPQREYLQPQVDIELFDAASTTDSATPAPQYPVQLSQDCHDDGIGLSYSR